MAPDARPRLAATAAPLGDAREACAFLSALGVAGVQLSATQSGMRPRELDASARRDLRAMLVRLGLEPSGLDLWIPSDHFLDPAHADRAIDAVRAACELASFLGRVPVVLALPARSEDPAQAARRDEVAAALADAADLHGIRLAVAGDARAGLRCPPFGMLLDPAALLALGADPIAAAARSAGPVVAARVVDQLRSGLRGPIGCPGDARLDVLAFRIALESSGFAGLPVIDARQWADPRGGVRQSVAAWMQAMPSIG